jgi:mannosylglycerate hydrolase
LRRRADGWLEVRMVNLASEPRAALLAGDLIDARDATLRGEPGPTLAVTDGALRLHLRPAEIRTVQVRRTESAVGHADVLDAPGPRQNA